MQRKTVKLDGLEFNQAVIASWAKEAGTTMQGKIRTIFKGI